ncbi:M20 family metallo-hydrolase [Marinivivus vitaminiproducens]|uniref:M20 family metallo-hydrolase n=1 Tax=Marinivivus vitaminiproducens TaxID=3035935 RepID=UPI0027A6B2AC|nr:M20 family metallo-hydrolase [Geminicoccaceae bacterium SCSIO 64248]
MDPALDAASGVNPDRLWQRLMTMATIGAIPGDGVDRAALSAGDIEARAVLIAWARERGFAVEVDEAANLFVRRPGTEARRDPILAGSHMDSQPKGGRFDGIFGVLAAFEALEALEDRGVATRHPVEAVAWTNEEGGRFSPGCMGSMSFTGREPLGRWLPIADAEGVTFETALTQTLAATPDLPRRPFRTPAHAYIEPHIEQGPTLEALDVPIGAVTGIQGSRWFMIEVHGEMAHAGTAPLVGRKDAMRAAVRAIAALQEACHDPEDVTRFTVGKIEALPGSYNTVPNLVRFSVDLRHPDAATLDRLGDRIARVCERAATPCSVTVEETFSQAPVVFPRPIVSAVENAARALGLRAHAMPSGAFHDAAFLAGHCPTGMIFIPCRNGISHNPAEYATPEHCAAGAAVLTAALVAMDATAFA